MKLKTPSNKEVICSILPSKYPLLSEEKSRSKGQYHLGQLILEIYGDGIVLLEEFSIPESRLSLDFFLPHYLVAFEFQGIQHDKFVAFFHNNKGDLAKQKQRDEEKKAWCDLNNITLVEIRDENITKDQLMDKIING